MHAADASAVSRPNLGRFTAPILWIFFALILAACSSSQAVAEQSADREFVSPGSSSTSSTTTSTTTTSTTTTTTTTLAPPLDVDDVPRVIRTTTDVVLPVLDVVDNGFLVRTPCQNMTIVRDGETESRAHVVIDPGHGGGETGAVSPDEITEKEINLEVALLAEELLEAEGFDIVLTRYTDIRVPILTRVEIADNLEVPLLVSIHHQSSEQFPTSEEPGTEVFYPRFSEESRRFAGLLVEESREELGVYDIEWFTGSDAGAVYRLNANTGTDFYGMIRRPQVPTVLAEMGFMGNEAELELMRSGQMQQAEAAAIRDAVIRWFTTDDPGVGFVEPSFELTAAGSGGGLGGCEDPDLGETFELPTELAESLASVDEETTEETSDQASDDTAE